MSAELEEFSKFQPRVLIFLPSTNELQRFVLAGAFDELAQDYELHYVVSTADLAKTREAASHALASLNTIELNVPPERYAKWAELFQAACVRYSTDSPSFAIRANFSSMIGRARYLSKLPSSMRPAVRDLASGIARQNWLPRGVSERANIAAKLLDQFEDRRTPVQFLKPAQYGAFVQQTLAGLSPMPEIIDIFDRIKPLFVIVPSSLLDLYCNEVLWACETDDVFCVLLQSGWDNLSSKGIIHHQPTVLGCWGEQSKRHAAVIQHVPKAALKVLGSPHYEFLKPASAADIAQFRKEIGVSDDQRLILFGGSFRQFDETWALKRLEAAVDSGQFGPTTILYRPHPWRAARQHEDDFFQQQWKHVVFDPDMKSRYVRARNEPSYLKREVPMYDMAYLARVLSAVDAVISPMSTLLLEALIMERPTMAVAFGDGKHLHNPSVTAQMTHFIEARKSGAFVWCENSNRFEEALGKLLSLGWNDKTKVNRQQFLARVLTQGPATYASRLAELVQDNEPYARKLRARRTSRKRKTISNAYGANLIARDYCGVALPEPQIPGYWMHGWIPAYHSVDPAFIALHKKDGQHASYDYEGQIRAEKLNTPQWVSREDQAKFLRSHGYCHVQAIGLPIIYSPEPEVRRVPGSLLVMPPHSHRNHEEGDPLAERYADMIFDVRKDFEHIWVCLHEDDLAKRQWVNSFRRRGIHVIPSADQSDPHTLLRLKRILHSFEYVTTNGGGSHIAYAAYCGAKVSIFGPFAEFPLDRMARTHAVKMFPRLRDVGYWLMTEEAWRKHYSFLFTTPKDAIVRRDWGRVEVGEPHRFPPNELARLFGWTVDADPISQLQRDAANRLHGMSMS